MLFGVVAFWPRAEKKGGGDRDPRARPRDERTRGRESAGRVARAGAHRRVLDTRVRVCRLGSSPAPLVAPSDILRDPPVSKAESRAVSSSPCRVSASAGQNSAGQRQSTARRSTSPSLDQPFRAKVNIRFLTDTPGGRQNPGALFQKAEPRGSQRRRAKSLERGAHASERREYFASKHARGNRDDRRERFDARARTVVDFRRSAGVSHPASLASRKNPREQLPGVVRRRGGAGGANT